MADAPEDLAAVRRDLGRALKLLDDKHKTYEHRKAMYDGTALEVSLSSAPALRKIVEDSAEAHPLSFAHIPVDACLDKVTLTGMKAQDEAADKVLTILRDELSLDDEVDDWHTKAGYFGDYYAIVDPQDETETGTATTLRASGSSPLTTIMLYSPSDSSDALFGVKRWKVGDGTAEAWRVAMYYDDVTLLLATAEGEKESGGGSNAQLYAPLVEVDDDEGTSWRVAHAGGRKLLVHYAVGSKPYGVPLHSKAFGPQDAVTKLSAINLSTADAQGFPSRYALADPLADIDDDIDDDFGTDADGTAAADRDGLTTATSGASRLRDIPGTIKLLRGIKSVGQFDAADPGGFYAGLDWYMRAMAVATGTPLFEFDLGGDQPSGEARRRAESRINRKAEKVQRTLGRSHVELADTMLAVLGIDPEVAKVSVTWQPVQGETDLEGFELVAAKVANGVPISTALTEAGYPEETVAEWYPDGVPHVTPDLAGKVAPALRDLGQAATLGVVTDAEIAAMVPTILTAARGEGPTPEAPAAEV